MRRTPSTVPLEPRDGPPYLTPASLAALHAVDTVPEVEAWVLRAMSWLGRPQLLGAVVAAAPVWDVGLSRRVFESPHGAKGLRARPAADRAALDAALAHEAPRWGTSYARTNLGFFAQGHRLLGRAARERLLALDGPTLTAVRAYDAAAAAEPPATALEARQGQHLRRYAVANVLLSHPDTAPEVAAALLARFPVVTDEQLRWLAQYTTVPVEAFLVAASRAVTPGAVAERVAATPRLRAEPALRHLARQLLADATLPLRDTSAAGRRLRTTLPALLRSADPVTDPAEYAALAQVLLRVSPAATMAVLGTARAAARALIAPAWLAPLLGSEDAALRADAILLAGRIGPAAATPGPSPARGGRAVPR